MELLQKKPLSVNMVFCNTTKGSYWLSETLTEAGIDNVLMNKEVDDTVSPTLLIVQTDNYSWVNACVYLELKFHSVACLLYMYFSR